MQSKEADDYGRGGELWVTLRDYFMEIMSKDRETAGLLATVFMKKYWLNELNN